MSGRIINDMGKLEYLEKNLSQCHFIHHLSHMNWSMIKPRTLRTKVLSHCKVKPETVLDIQGTMQHDIFL
jgi:hypothetical protein